MALNRRSLTFVFLKYLLIFVFAASFIFILSVSFFMYGLNNGGILPANFVENYVRNNRDSLEKGETNYKDIPFPGKYLVVDKDGNQKDTNMGEEGIKDYELAKEGNGNRYFYMKIERAEDVIFVQYDLKAKYSDPVLNRVLPSPELLYIMVPILINVILALGISYLFKKKMKGEIDSILQMTEKIKAQDLDFTAQASSIVEFNAAIDSLDSMKEALKKSLEEQWAMEKERLQQVASITHDINTPLAIIKGSMELMMEEEDANPYHKTVINNIHRIEEYLAMLKSHTANDPLVFEDYSWIDTVEFVNRIEEEGDILCRKNQRSFKVYRDKLPERFKGDFEELKRGVFNLLNNSIRFTENKGKIELFFYAEEKSFFIEVRDNGKGFSKEALRRGKEVFYTETKESGEHLGMGISIAESIVKRHGGALKIQNRTEDKGAQVILKIPLGI